MFFIIPIPIFINSKSSKTEGIQLTDMKITNITEKEKYVKASFHSEYEVLYINASEEYFLIKDDDSNAVWVEFDKCKVV